MFGIAIHGGAGTLPRADMSADAERRYRAGLKEAIDAGFAELAAGGTSMDAVTRAVVLLEDNPLFNAGRGAVFTLDGRNELDASIMDGSTLKAGAICGVTRIRNPVELARAVMEKSEQVMLAGTGAEEFAAAQGFSFVPQSYFYTPERWMQLERIRGGDAGLSALTISHIGTVGAVAVDAQGRLAAATSTGGMTGKRYQRIGDSPSSAQARMQTIAHAPCPPRDMAKYFIRAVVAHDICARMRFGGRSIGEAVREVVLGELPALGGEGGVIAIDARGEIAIEFNSEGMFRASRRQGEEMQIGIYTV